MPPTAATHCYHPSLCRRPLLLTASLSHLADRVPCRSSCAVSEARPNGPESAHDFYKRREEQGSNAFQRARRRSIELIDQVLMSCPVWLMSCLCADA